MTKRYFSFSLGLCLFLLLSVNISHARDGFTFAFAGHIRPPEGLGSVEYNQLKPNLLLPFFIEQVNILNPDFIITGGDHTAGYLYKNNDKINKEWDFILHFLKQIKVKHYLVPGNHDVYSDESVRIWEEKIGPLYQSFIYKNAKFILLHSSLTGEKREKFEALEYFGILQSREQRDFLEKEIVKAESNDLINHIFIFLHHDVWNPRRIPKEHINIWWEKYHSLLKKSPKVKAVYSGNGNDDINIIEKDHIKYIIHGWGSFDDSSGREFSPIGGNFLLVTVSGSFYNINVVPLNNTILNYNRLMDMSFHDHYYVFMGPCTFMQRVKRKAIELITNTNLKLILIFLFLGLCCPFVVVVVLYNYWFALNKKRKPDRHLSL